MKKVLFATTALVATAGIASADVALTGSAEMGVVGGSGSTITQFHQDIDVTFTLSGETGNGITFGAAVDLDEIAGGAGGATNDDFGYSVFISGDFGTLTLGDTDGGFDAGMLEVPAGPGSIDDAHTGHSGWNGFNQLDGVYDGQILSYAYSVSGFTVTASVEMDDDRERAAPVAPATSNAPFGELATQPATDGLTGDAVYGIGAVYAGSFGGGSYNVGVGYQTVNDIDPLVAGAQGYTAMGISGNVTLDNGLSVGATYATYEGFSAGNEGTHMGIGASYAFDDISVGVNYGVYDWETTALVADTSGFGLSAAYDLGGGLSARLGYGSSTVDAVNATAPAATLGTTSTWSLGMAMSF
ncbi:porin [Hasllibacter sp. MH4015]|uniref:porin n=1 Tax=Hasllibacter sp. MH4015 TaxID=2854029 RepID=UPI001CD628F7|nr:porin [Hasllibacter sp. MH4015]